MTLSIERAATIEMREMCYAIRSDVFVGEQGVPVELEIDSHDETDAEHLIAHLGSVPIGTLRTRRIALGVKIQRVAVLRAFRGRGFGRDLLGEAIRRNAPATFLLDAQVDATRFYTTLGFAAEGERFLDAGIEHIRMVRPADIAPPILERR